MNVFSLEYDWHMREESLHTVAYDHHDVVHSEHVILKLKAIYVLKMTLSFMLEA